MCLEGSSNDLPLDSERTRWLYPQRSPSSTLSFQESTIQLDAWTHAKYLKEGKLPGNCLFRGGIDRDGVGERALFHGSCVAVRVVSDIRELHLAGEHQVGLNQRLGRQKKRKNCWTFPNVEKTGIGEQGEVPFSSTNHTMAYVGCPSILLVCC